MGSCPTLGVDVFQGKQKWLALDEHENLGDSIIDTLERLGFAFGLSYTYMSTQ
ncbi:hypothetical protein P3T32_003213 [Ralstonia sp. GP73]|jgi:hypothetical protein|nr:hypothetical protein [Ralstonia sp. GP73]